MKSLPLRDAKASLSAVVEAAERGEATTITKRGRPAAVVVSVDDARRLYGANRPSFAALLMGIPHPIGRCSLSRCRQAGRRRGCAR
jgi:antitoxin Phd